MRAIRIDGRGQPYQADLPKARQSCKFRYSAEGAAPTRKESGLIKKAIQELAAGPAGTMKVWLHFYTEGNYTPVLSLPAQIQWTPPSPSPPRVMPTETWNNAREVADQLRSVQVMLRTVDPDHKVRWHNARHTYANSPGSPVELAEYLENLKEATECPNCQAIMDVDEQDWAYCDQCGQKVRIQLKLELSKPKAPDPPEMNPWEDASYLPSAPWTSLWNHGYAYLGKIWEANEDNLQRALNRPENIPEYREWYFTGDDQYPPDEAEDTELDGEESGWNVAVIDDFHEWLTSPELAVSTGGEFERRYPGARVCALDMLQSSRRTDLERVTELSLAKSAKLLTEAAQDWSPVLETMQLAYRANPELDDCPGSAMDLNNLYEVIKALSRDGERLSDRDALTRGLRLSRAYRGIAGTPAFPPSDTSLAGWNQWIALPRWGRTMFRCANAITRALDPNGDIRRRYEEHEILDALLGGIEVEPERATWREAIQEIEAKADGRFNRDEHIGASLFRDDALLLGEIALSRATERQGHRTGSALTRRRALHWLDSPEFIANLGRPASAHYFDQDPKAIVVEERLSPREREKCGVSRRLRIALLFHSVNSKGEMTRRKADGELTGAHDLWMSRYWWQLPREI